MKPEGWQQLDKLLEPLAKLGVSEIGSALCGETAKRRVCSACLLVCFYNLRKLLGKAFVFVRTATTQARWGLTTSFSRAQSASTDQT